MKTYKITPRLRSQIRIFQMDRHSDQRFMLVTGEKIIALDMNLNHLNAGQDQYTLNMIQRGERKEIKRETLTYRVIIERYEALVSMVTLWEREEDVA